jgi:hypothetical protein
LRLEGTGGSCGEEKGISAGMLLLEVGALVEKEWSELDDMTSKQFQYCYRKRKKKDQVNIR